ncbi:MAG: hypothetical protein ACLFVW_06565 [Phycisphaerae bacterium]
MPEPVSKLIDRLSELVAYRLDAEAIRRAKRRHADVMAGRETDYLPVIFEAPVSETADWPAFNWRQRFEDPEKSLYMQLKDMVLPRAAGGGDYVPGVRPDLGTINCQTVFGAGYQVPEHTRAVIDTYMPKDRLAEFEVPEDVSCEGVIPRMVEHLEHHRDALASRGLGELISVWHCDQQGPFDIAAMVRGHEIFIDLYEDGDFVHDLMSKCTDVYVKVSRLCKRLNGEGDGPGNALGIWMERGAVRMCGDSDILVSPRQHEEFILPYQKRAFDALGGGWMHYCGGQAGYNRPEGLHLHELYAKIDTLAGLNWTTAGDWIGEMRRLKDLGLVHIGTVPREDGESLEDYYARVLSAYDRRWGLIFGMTWGGGPELRDGEHGGAVQAWREAQDRYFGV